MRKLKAVIFAGLVWLAAVIGVYGCGAVNEDSIVAKSQSLSIENPIVVSDPVAIDTMRAAKPDGMPGQWFKLETPEGPIYVLSMGIQPDVTLELLCKDLKGAMLEAQKVNYYLIWVSYLNGTDFTIALGFDPSDNTLGAFLTPIASPETEMVWVNLALDGDFVKSCMRSFDAATPEL
jgi:hypothetical protein